MISKKELLKEMNISYGQLYRWKREGLIPDQWFVKQSVSTGQETFFNPEDIIPRIKTILELKDKYQLEQIKEYLNPDITAKKFRVKEVMAIDLIDPFIAKKFLEQKQEVSLFDVILIYIFSKYQDVLNYDDYIDYDFRYVDNIDKIFYIIEMDKYYILITDSNAIIDKNIKIYQKIKLEEISSEIAKKI